MAHLDIKEIINRCDDFFNAGNTAAAGEFLREKLALARQLQNQGAELTILNELIGHYRMMSDPGRGINAINDAVFLLEKVTYRERPEGLLAVAKMRKHELSDLPEYENMLYLVAETIEKPGNLGSMLRSADASGTDALIVCERMTDLYNPNVIRASTGAIFSVPTAVCDNQSAMDYLRSRGVKILAATPHTDFKYTDVDLTQPVAVVVGAEQTGLTDFWMDQADLKVNIPMLGEIDSLNVASAATILLYEAARQRNFKKRVK